MNKNVLQHFRKEEAPYLDYCQGLCDQARNQYRPILTHFLNPRQVYLLTVISNSFPDLKLNWFGGHPDAEMQRGLIYPSYFSPARSDFNVALVEVKYPYKFAQLKHSQILGTLMGAGIKRNVIGDIITDGRRWQFFAEKNMVTFLKFQIKRINRCRVTLAFPSWNEVINPENDWRDRFEVVASLRLDSVISAGFNLSRNRSKSLITHHHVRLNWALVTQSNVKAHDDDIVSVRHFGRLKIKDIRGKSKKGKLKIILSVIKK